MLKITLKLLSLSLLTIGFTSFAQDEGVVQGSGLFLEPGITYQSVESNINYPAPLTNSSASVTGLGVVLRGGVHLYERFFIAADARYGFMQKFNDNANGLSVDATSWDIAPTVGFQMADYGLRLYGGYILAGDLDPKGANTYDFRFQNPTGYRVGAGLKLQMVSVNIEWQSLDYDKTNIQEVGGFAANVDTKQINYSGDGVVVSLTFPFEFE